MLYQGVLIARASGRLDQSVFSHNRGGPYIRALGNPNPNPETGEQTVIRSAMAQLIDAWRTGLSEPDRQAWRDFSEDFPRIGRSGVERAAGGLPEFTACNIRRRQYVIAIGATPIDLIYLPPSSPWGDFDPAELLIFDPFVGSGDVRIACDPAAPWFSGQGGLLIYIAPPLRPSVRFYKSPMTLLAFLSPGTTDGDLFTIPETFIDGDRCRIKLVALYDDGRQSLPYWRDADAV